MVGYDLQIKHPAERTFHDHDIIERTEMFGIAARVTAFDHRLQRDSPVDLKIAAYHASQGRPGLVNGDFGKESQAAEVDPKDRRFALADQSGRPEQGAIPAQHDYQIGLLRQLRWFSRDRPDFVRGQRLTQRDQTLRFQPSGQVSGQMERLGGAILPHHQTNRTYNLLRRHRVFPPIMRVFR
jgi:hypothetical protein